MFKRLSYGGFIFILALAEVSGRGYAGQILLNHGIAAAYEPDAFGQTTSAPHDICKRVLSENTQTTLVSADFGQQEDDCLDLLRIEYAAQFDSID